MNEEQLNRVIEDFSHRNLNLFFRGKCENYAETLEDLPQYDEEEKFSDFQKLGEIRFDDGDRLVVTTSRVMKDLSERSGKRDQYEKAKKILKELALYDAGFFIFHDDVGSFRFSLVYGQAEGTKKSWSNFRRFTYFVNKGQTNTTFRIRVGRCTFSSLDSVKDAFSVEKVNKEFYNHIARFFYRLTGYECEREMTLPSVSGDDKKTYQEFAVRLIGRTIFCWFLKHKKSVVGEPLVPRGILSSDAVYINKEYYHNVLEKLFFEVLNTPQKQRRENILPDADKIPFLNGGLFEPHKLNDFYNGQPQYNLVIPDGWFEQFFKILEQYNFTIDENSTVDADVSVDPEMLGRIFENLLAEVNPDTGESARKATGSYYTPRTIVDYMVDQSLKQYLLTKTRIDEGRITALLSYEAPEVSLSDSEKVSVISALDEIKIIDPACGSGAFPMGVLHKMLLVLNKVDPDLRIWVDKRLERIADDIFKEEIKNKLERDNLEYVRKLIIIRNSIFGVDIQQIAVEISKLRVFLSLIVDEKIDDEEENRGIKSLPNLEFKFVAANSLLGLPKAIPDRKALIDFEDKESIEVLARIRDNYFTSYGEDKLKAEQQFIEVQKKMFRFYLQNLNQEQRNLVGTIKKVNTTSKTVTQMLSEWEPFSYKQCEWFDPKWMFGIEDGFDIVIANPPYIEFKKMSDSTKATHKSYSTATGKYDIYVLFIEFAKNILNPGGTLCFINPTTFMKKDYGVGLRKFISQNLCIRHIQDFGDIQAFENVTNYTGIFLLTNYPPTEYQFEYHKYKNIGRDITYSEFGEGLNSPKEFKDIITINSNLAGSSAWNFQPSQAKDLLEKISMNSKPLTAYVAEVFEGIASGKDEVFYISEDVIKEYKIEQDIIFPLLKGRDIKAYVINWSGSYVLYPYDDDSQVYSESEMKKSFPNALSYFKLKRRLLAGRAYFDKSNKLWFELWNQRKLKNFKKLRIVTPEISDKNNFAITDTFFGNTKTYHIILKSNEEQRYLAFLGLLNSKLLDTVYKLIATPHAGGFYAYKTQFLNLLPISDKFSDYEERISQQVRLILKAKNSNPASDIRIQEASINRMVYELYGLTNEEVTVIDSPNFNHQST
ncbi:MAG: TaqI-like C-terminal specificity domain-containing protein [Dehalococcoides mccartyi]|uniref:Eco57I restriction-modification methylase domain-containing protein n=1 Tax=Dehalococcoides mccartyi TaxID=61435 RepID=UPI0030F7D941